MVILFQAVALLSLAIVAYGAAPQAAKAALKARPGSRRPHR